MAHDKVYGFCEAKCKVEVVDKAKFENGKEGQVWTSDGDGDGVGKWADLPIRVARCKCISGACDLGSVTISPASSSSGVNAVSHYSRLSYTTDANMKICDSDEFGLRLGITPKFSPTEVTANNVNMTIPMWTPTQDEFLNAIADCFDFQGKGTFYMEFYSAYYYSSKYFIPYSDVGWTVRGSFSDNDVTITEIQGTYINGEKVYTNTSYITTGDKTASKKLIPVAVTLY